MLNACAQSIAAAQGEADLAPGKVRRKMAVGEGRSMMHWMNVRPKNKRQRWVTMDEIKQVVNGPMGPTGTLQAIGRRRVARGGFRFRVSGFGFSGCPSAGYSGTCPSAGYSGTLLPFTLLARKTVEITSWEGTCTYRTRHTPQHNKAEDAWTVFRGKVYDCTPFFEYHPGGAKFMLAVSAVSVAVPHIRRGHLT